MSYYFIFYVNLSFSALSKDDQIKVINICLEKLVALAESGYKFGIQMSGISLELVQAHRPDLISALRNLIASGNVDFIGNGYSQVIQPLFPHRLNYANQFFGLETYEKLLGYRPKIASVNEMALSEGSIQSFIDNQYDTILMEYENVSQLSELNDDLQFSPIEFSAGDQAISVIWCHTVAFQKFQKYVHGEISLDKYIEWLNEFTKQQEGVLCLYCSDAEIFDFRPKRYGTEIEPEYNEWDRIEDLLKLLQSDTILPSRTLDIKKGTVRNLTTSEYPVIVKKQEKYNINRWAITGRDDQKLNTFCYSVFEVLKNESLLEIPHVFKDLLKLASSDLRTHIESGRWSDAQKIKTRLEKSLGIARYQDDMSLPEINANSIIVNEDRGKNIVAFPAIEPALNYCALGEFKDLKFMADFYSGFMLIERPGVRKISDLDYKRSVSKNWINSYLHADGTRFQKEFLSISENNLVMRFSIECPARIKQQIRIANFTLSPKFLDVNSSRYSVNLGGTKRESFSLNKIFDQDQNLNLNTFGKNGFTPTDGHLIIQDDQKTLTFTADPAECFYLIRLSSHIENGKQLVRVSYITQDIDETFIERDSPDDFMLTIGVSVSR